MLYGAIVPVTYQQDVPARSGSYVLLMLANRRLSITVGALGRLRVEPGVYLYVGSAFGSGGLRARLSRHLGPVGCRHWHVDYLRGRAPPVEAWFQQQLSPVEHAWAAALARGKGIQPVFPGFGASDCRCETHLFYSPQLPSFAAFGRPLASLAAPAPGGLTRLIKG